MNAILWAIYAYNILTARKFVCIYIVIDVWWIDFDSWMIRWGDVSNKWWLVVMLTDLLEFIKIGNLNDGDLGELVIKLWNVENKWQLIGQLEPMTMVSKTDLWLLTLYTAKCSKKFNFPTLRTPISLLKLKKSHLHPTNHFQEITNYFSFYFIWNAQDMIITCQA